jgi:hypothetical protein
MLPVSVNFPFLIASSVFSKGFFETLKELKFCMYETLKELNRFWRFEEFVLLSFIFLGN